MTSSEKSTEIPNRLYDVDQDAYHESVHNELVDMGFKWKDCWVKVSGGKVITRIYWRSQSLY